MELEQLEKSYRAGKLTLREVCAALYPYLAGTSDRFTASVAVVARHETTDANLKALMAECDLADPVGYQTAFVAFYILCGYYRRHKDVTRYRELLAAWESQFENEPIYWIQVMVYYKTAATSVEDLRKCFVIWERMEPRLQEMPAFIQAYTEAVAVYYESGQAIGAEDTEKIEKAVGQLEYALLKRTYPKYYATKGRLEALLGNYADAMRDLSTAIDKEDSASADYSIRINDYQNALTQIKIKSYYAQELSTIRQYKDTINEMKSDVEKSKFDVLSFLGFFTALISITIGSFQVADGLVFLERVQLIIVLSACIMMAFVGLRMIVHPTKKARVENAVIFSAAILIICLTLFLLPVLM